MWVGIDQSLEDLNTTQKQREAESALFAGAGPGVSPALDISLLVPRPSGWDRAYIISSPGPRAFGLGLNYTTSFPGSPAPSQQLKGLPGLYNHMSQFLY